MPDAVGFMEQAEHEAVARPCSTRREQTRPALPPQRLADPLVRRPGLASGAGDGEADARQTLFRGQIRDLESCVAVQVHRSRGICWSGGMPASARWRYHSAQTVAASLAR
jgi:hypothetical protein